MESCTTPGVGPKTTKPVKSGIHFKLVVEGRPAEEQGKGGADCSLCAVSCQSACKTSCTVGNQSCEK